MANCLLSVCFCFFRGWLASHSAELSLCAGVLVLACSRNHGVSDAQVTELPNIHFADGYEHHGNLRLIASTQLWNPCFPGADICCGEPFWALA